MICPDCKNPYKCGCKSCVEREPNLIHSKVISDDEIACGYCNKTMSDNEWFEEEMRQYDESKKTKNKILDELAEETEKLGIEFK